jgi:hypothetical protein
MMTAEHQKEVTVIKKAQILLKLLNKEEIESTFSEFSAIQLKNLRNFFEEEVYHVSAKHDSEPIPSNSLKARYEPVDRYYTRQDCREPIEACTSETCYTSNPICFSRKMESQINVLTDILKSYLFKDNQDGKNKSEEIQ